jgi:hypothetical protein
MRWVVGGGASFASLACVGCGRIAFESTTVATGDAPRGDVAMMIDAPEVPISSTQVQFQNTSSTNVATIVMPSQQSHGLNVLTIAYSLSQTITSVTDTAGNTYAVATPGLDYPSTGQQAIYYAADIAAAASNTITVNLTGNVSQVDLVALEYAGLPAAPLDTTAAATGNSVNADSGALTTTVGHELLLAAALFGGANATPDPAFTLRGDYGSYVVDRVVETAGTYDATIALAPASGWVMQLVAFRGM